jgi:hypothetical protein
MSTGGIFQLITNDGKQDKMLTATAFLNQRLLEVENIRAANGVVDPTPRLTDIERTHILFMNAHFKPYAAIGYEYQKTSVQSGTARLGSNVTFSIPQFGDFFYDMVLHLTLSSVSATNSEYWSAPADNPAAGNELLRYVDYLGQRLVERVEFTVNSNPLDQYQSDALNFHRKFYVPPNKQVGWDKCVGQEVPRLGYADVGLANGRFGRGAGVREKRFVLDGPQTPKPTQPAIDLWVPLLFWFNTDPRLCIPSVCIPYGQRDINVTFAPVRNILQHLHAYDPTSDAPGSYPVETPEITTCDLYINNIFVNPEIHDIFIRRVGFNLIRVHRYQSSRVTKATDRLLMSSLKWPIETLYLGLRPTCNIDTTSTNMLENWHIYAQMTDTTINTCGISNYPLLLADLGETATVADVETALGFDDGSDPDETVRAACGVDLHSIQIITGAAAADAASVTVLNEWLGYYNFVLLDPANFVDPDNPTPAELNAEWPEPGRGGAGCCQLRYKVCTPTITTLKVEAQGIELYKNYSSLFYNQYIPYQYGGVHITTPEDCGVCMIPFNLYPGTYQPSGYINISRAREFYIEYVSPTVGSTIAAADFIVYAIAINFLLVSDGSAILRYST